MASEKLWLVNKILHIFEKSKNSSICLTSTQKLIIISLAHFYPNIAPSYNYLINMTSLSRRCIIKNISCLKAKKILCVDERFDRNGDMTSNKFTIKIENIFISIALFEEYISKNLSTGVVHEVHHPVHQMHYPGARGAPPPVHEVHPNYINLTTNLTKRTEILKSKKKDQKIDYKENVKKSRASSILEDYMTSNIDKKFKID